MSSEKNIRVIVRMSEEDKTKLKEISVLWACPESYVIRRAITVLHEKLTEDKEEK